MLRTLKFALRHDLANSRAVGYQVTQQNAAYNRTVDVLNREPKLPKRSGRNQPDAINKRITAWRPGNRRKPTRLTTSTRKAVNRFGKPTNDYNRHVPSGRYALPTRKPRVKNPSTGTSANILARRRIAPEKPTGSASLSPTSGYSKSPTTVVPSSAINAGSPYDCVVRKT